MTNQAPYYQMAGPADVWVADAGEDEPDLAVAVPTGAGAYRVLGNNSLTDTGIEITRGQEMFSFRRFGNLGASKSFRISESYAVKVEVADMSADTYGEVMGLDVETVTPGTDIAGAKRVKLLRGRTVKYYTLLVRQLISPYGPGDFGSQLWIPRCEIDPLEEPNITEGEIQMLGVTFAALEDPTDGFGYKTDQTAAPS